LRLVANRLGQPLCRRRRLDIEFTRQLRRKPFVRTQRRRSVPELSEKLHQTSRHRFVRGKKIPRAPREPRCFDSVTSACAFFRGKPSRARSELAVPLAFAVEPSLELRYVIDEEPVEEVASIQRKRFGALPLAQRSFECACVAPDCLSAQRDFIVTTRDNGRFT
jgi:hypothetical protein